jgi:hypothetical protein
MNAPCFRRDLSVHRIVCVLQGHDEPCFVLVEPMLHDLSHGPAIAHGELDHGENQLDVAPTEARLRALLGH